MARDDRLPAALAARFRALGNVPEGLIEHRVGQVAQIAVARDGRDIFMAFCPLGVPLSNATLSAVMARVDPGDPLLLRGRYMQAMLAAHAFSPAPARVCILGAGGGRLALVQRFLLGVPEVTGAELDPAVLALSRRHFGLKPAPGLRIEAAEGRAYLAAQSPERFDHVYVDCFTADGRVPETLATLEAIGTMRRALRPEGVLAINHLARDPNAPAIAAGLVRCFGAVWAWEEAGSRVLFGVAGRASPGPSPFAAQDLGFDLDKDIARLSRLPPFAAPTPLRDADLANRDCP